MNKNELIITTIYALANGMHKSWISQDFCDALMSVHASELSDIKAEELCRVHKAARKALKALSKLPSPHGWDEIHVVLLGKIFCQEARYKA